MRPFQLSAQGLRVLFCAYTLASTINAQCTEANMKVRKEWSTLTTSERLSYIKSVQCLMDKPAQTPSEVVPAVRNRYDDFTALHVNQTVYIHGNGIFLGWHRHFLHLYHTALEEECGYDGPQPYWNWAWWSNDLASNPIFDGSETSLGGDGLRNDSAALTMVNGNFTYPRGNGGGCIAEGPFANVTAPFRGFTNDELALPETPADALSYAPRCVTRDLNNAISDPNLNTTAVSDLLSKTTIADFQDTIDNVREGTPFLGPHVGGHWAIGWGLEDQYASPADPTFYLHHGMVDNVWAQWQAVDPENRQFALDGTDKTLNLGGSPATVDTILEFGYLDTQKRLGDVMDTTKQANCYRYEYDQSAPQPF